MFLSDLDESWDLIVVGGGITGAGILLAASRMGLRALLLEQNDFAWGTSSRSSKLVHGGLRYLKQGKFLLTRASVKERERLVKEVPGLVDPVRFLLPVYEGHRTGRWILELGLTIYDIMAGRKQHGFHDPSDFLAMEPKIKGDGLLGGFHFMDAQVDDARLVLRLIDESLMLGGCGVNYTMVTQIMRNSKGNVVGVAAKDTLSGETKELLSKTVINATGVWAENLHPLPETGFHLRPLRGSHLIFSTDTLPISSALSFFHPEDKRPVFAIPWEGAVLFGTTDVDHQDDISLDPVISEQEISYLMEGLYYFFPSLDISKKDCIATLAGVRPVLGRPVPGKGKIDPSKESREHMIWVNKGLVTVTGGKLTTFRMLARNSIKAAGPFLPKFKGPNKSKPDKSMPDKRDPVFSHAEISQELSKRLSPQTWRRLKGRYGKAANKITQMSHSEDFVQIPGTHTLWAELPFAAKHEHVRHLSDLLLRRVRVGLLIKDGGMEHMDRIQKLCQPVLPWDEKRWEDEKSSYKNLWELAYSVPD
jgi:glycerol-3-phosphate dehydrogenase